MAAEQLKGYGWWFWFHFVWYKEKIVRSED